MEQIESRDIELKSICLNQLKRIVPLRFDVHANNIEPCLVIAHSCATGLAEQIKDSWPVQELGLTTRPERLANFKISPDAEVIMS